MTPSEPPDPVKLVTEEDVALALVQSGLIRGRTPLQEVMAAETIFGLLNDRGTQRDRLRSALQAAFDDAGSGVTDEGESYTGLWMRTETYDELRAALSDPTEEKP